MAQDYNFPAMKPLANNVLIEVFEKDGSFAGGQLLLPEGSKERPQYGLVIAAGEGKINEGGTRIPLDVAKGDSVLFGRYAGTELKQDGKTYLIIRAEDIIAVLAD